MLAFYFGQVQDEIKYMFLKEIRTILSATLIFLYFASLPLSSLRVCRRWHQLIRSKERRREKCSRVMLIWAFCENTASDSPCGIERERERECSGKAKSHWSGKWRRTKGRHGARAREFKLRSESVPSRTR